MDLGLFLGPSNLQIFLPTCYYKVVDHYKNIFTLLCPLQQCSRNNFKSCWHIFLCSFSSFFGRYQGALYLSYPWFSSLIIYWKNWPFSHFFLFSKCSYSLFAIFCLNKSLPSIIVSMNILLYICAFINIRYLYYKLLRNVLRIQSRFGNLGPNTAVFLK